MSSRSDSVWHDDIVNVDYNIDLDPCSQPHLMACIWIQWHGQIISSDISVLTLMGIKTERAIISYGQEV